VGSSLEDVLISYESKVGNYQVVPEKMAIVRRIFEEIGVHGNSMLSVKSALSPTG
jgi:hypothetical protein